MGVIARGLGARWAPLRFLSCAGEEPVTAELAEAAEEVLSFGPGSRLSSSEEDCGAFFVLRAELVFVLRAGFSATSACSAVVRFFRSALAIESASHAFLPRAGAAARLLCHSRERASPPISASERLLNTDQSSLGSPASNGDFTLSSRCLMSSHSLPFDPGLRERMRARTKSPFSFFPLRRNLRSPLVSMA